MHSRPGPQSLLLIGPPNSGKTTLFNWLTGSRFRAVNYPGSTVDCLKGMSHPRYGASAMVVDSPGIYGLEPHSPDEEITLKLLHHEHGLGRLDGAIVCVDMTQLERHLPLALAVQKMKWPTVVALTMPDLAQEAGMKIAASELSGLVGMPVIQVSGRTGSGVGELMDAARQAVPVDTQQDGSKLTGWLKKHRKFGSPQQRTARLDRWLLHPGLGLLFFTLIMMSLFTAVFWLADPAMQAVDSTFAALGEFIHTQFPKGMAVDFLADGIVASFASVIVFAPQIFILFILLGIMEDSGYLARAATIVDKPLSKLGLSGRSFVPLLSGYACAVPAIMAARAIRSRRERWLAVFVIPLLSCSARLPVYALLLGFLFWQRPAWMPGIALAVIYLGSFLVGGVAAAILDRLLPGRNTSTFMMELPLYRRPQWRVVFHNAVTRTRSYVKRAGPVIFTLALLLWFGTNFPRPAEDVSSSQAVQQSYLGHVGQFVEPVFRPMGVDWRVGVGLLSAFAAREVFVSALTLVFDVTTDGPEESVQQALLGKLREAKFADGTPIFTLSSIIGLILFVMIALQCTSTTAIAAKEMGSWRFAIGQVVALNIVAYLVAVGVVQLMHSLGI